MIQPRKWVADDLDYVGARLVITECVLGAIGPSAFTAGAYD